MSPEDDERRLLTLLLKREREQQRQRSEAQALLSRRASILSPKQRAFYDDTAVQIVAICTRQSGKSTTGLEKFAAKLFGGHDRIGYACMPTRDIVRDTLWDRWKSLCGAFGLTDDDHNETRLETRLHNGSIARFIGVKDKKRADRIRGQTADIVLIDEAATFADDLLRYLVEDCCDAALRLRKGPKILTSTPGMQPEGYLYDVYTKAKYEFSRHFFELKDNPAWADPEAELRDVMRRFGFTAEEPKFIREWLGRWVADTRSRVYRLEDRNLIDEAAPYDMTVMALDLGATDESAICVIGWKHGSRKLQVLHEEADSDLDLTSIAERVKELQAQYRPLVTMVDGAAKQSVLEIQNRHGIALEATPKAPNYKPKAIQQVNADLRRGLVEIPRHFELVGQMRALQWKEKAIGVRENPGQPNDRCDAFLYAWLRALHYVEHEPEAPIKVGSPEWWKQEQQRVRDEHVQAHQPRDDHDPFRAESDPFSAKIDPW